MNNDLISRSALKAKIPELDSHDDCIDIWLKRDDVEDLIDNAPAVEAVSLEHHNKIKGILDNEVKSLVDILDKGRPKGEWIFVARHCYKCPFCQELSREGNFCPNCGAEMRGGAE